MPSLSVPEDGLLLLRTPTSERNQTSNSSLPSQVMRLGLAQKATEEIWKSFHNKDKVSIRFGKRIIVQHGKKSQPIFAYTESNPSELYHRSADDEHTFYFSGKLTHRLETQRAQTDTAKADEALANLENSLKSYKEQKASNEARIVTDPQELRQLGEACQRGKQNGQQSAATRRDRLLNTVNRPTPSSPFLGTANSPAAGHTSAARSGPASLTQDQIKLNAIKIPFLHLLAVKPLTPRSLAETIRATEEDCEKLLHKYGKESREANKKQELKDKAYRELDLWKFPYPSEEDRQAAIDRAISAFDRMRISTSDQIWETLLPVKERGKGKGSELSRLKIGQGAANGVTPKLSLGQGVGAETNIDHGKPTGKAKGLTAKTKPRSGTNDDQEKSSTVRKDAIKQLKQVNGKDTLKKDKKKAAPNSKFKSAEIIEDSDEELQGTQPSIEDTKESSKSSSTKVKSSTANQPSKPANATTNGRPSMPSSRAQPKVNGGLMPKSALTRPRAESTTDKASPRPRTDSSPQKPSPLASSPPTNATDLGNSQSSKPNSLTSASSSPANTPHLDRSQKASTASKASESRPTTSATKRKASNQISALPKRQEQLNGNYVARPATNGITKSQHNNTTTTTSSQRTRTPPSSSTSTTSSSSRPSTTATTNHLQSDLQMQSRRFKIQYARYQTLHTKIMALPDRERDDEEVRVLRKMHARIGELKREIWERWEREREKGGSGTGGKGSVKEGVREGKAKVR